YAWSATSGGSDEKAISRKRSARRIRPRHAGIRCRKAATSSTGLHARARRGLHELERLLCRRQRRDHERLKPALRFRRLRHYQESNTRSGWTAGGGIEYALGYGWSVKSEFLYADFGTYTTFTAPPFGALDIAPRQVKVKDYIWRAGMNYKFW